MPLCLLSRGCVCTVLDFNCLLGCMSLGFIAYVLAGPSAWLSGTTFLALLVDLIRCVFVGFRLGYNCWVRVSMIGSGLLNFFRCCALRLAGKS